jgi:hypothetical protein
MSPERRELPYLLTLRRRWSCEDEGLGAKKRTDKIEKYKEKARMMTQEEAIVELAKMEVSWIKANAGRPDGFYWIVVTVDGYPSNPPCIAEWISKMDSFGVWYCFGEDVICHTMSCSVQVLGHIPRPSSGTG